MENKSVKSKVKGIILILVKNVAIIAIYLFIYYGIILMSDKFYASVWILNSLTSSFIRVIICSICVIVDFIKPQNKNLRIKIFFYFIILAPIVLFIFTKPAYTYNQAYEIVSEKYENVEILSEKSIHNLSFRYTSFSMIRRLYLFGGEDSGMRVYILFNPASGEILTELIGSKSYIDYFFEYIETQD